MSWLKPIKAIFSSGELLTKGAEILDEAIYTNQEKSGHKLKLLSLYEPYKLIQRLLALMVTGCFLFLHMMYALADFYLVAKGHEPVFDGMSARNNEVLGEGWTWIMVWYFSGGVIEGGVKAFKGLKK